MRCRITPILRAKATFPRFEPRRLAKPRYPREQNIGSFIECRTYHLIPGSRNSAGDIFFTRLILLRCQPAPTAFAIRLGSSTADLKVTATTEPTPGTVISR